MVTAIREMLQRDPFVPFQIVMNSGDRITIENADLAVIGDNSLTYCLPRSNTVLQLSIFQITFVQVDVP